MAQERDCALLSPWFIYYLAPVPTRKGVQPIAVQRGSFLVAGRALTRSVPRLWGHQADGTSQCPVCAEAGPPGRMLGPGKGPQTLTEPQRSTLQPWPGDSRPLHGKGRWRARSPRPAPRSLKAVPGVPGLGGPGGRGGTREDSRGRRGSRAGGGEATGMGTGDSGMKGMKGCMCREDGGWRDESDREAVGTQEWRRGEAERRLGWGQQGTEGWRGCGDERAGDRTGTSGDRRARAGGTADAASPYLHVLPVEPHHGRVSHQQRLDRKSVV